ncbi:MAG: hypothetical protein SWY16_03830 [Cyanobacteriota bacterium]|nr:hypothetical protein [Cyanobacteriota bacterium]
MSSADRPNKIASILRLPLVSKKLAGTLRQPTYAAIAASLGLHGVVGVGFALVSPNGLGNSPGSTRMVETNLVELTPEEVRRLPSPSTIPVRRLPPNSNMVGNLPSLNGPRTSRSSRSSTNSGDGLPPSPLGYFFGSNAPSGEGTSESQGSVSTGDSGIDYSYVPDNFYPPDDWSYLFGHQNNFYADDELSPDDLESDRQKEKLQVAEDPKKLPGVGENPDTENSSEESQAASGSETENSPTDPVILAVLGGIPPTVSLDAIRGEYPVIVRVDADGNAIEWELLEGADNAILQKAIELNLAMGFPAQDGEQVYQFVLVFDENSSMLNAQGSEEQQQLEIEDLASADTQPDTEIEIAVLEPHFYAAADLGLSPEELSVLASEAVVEITVTPEGTIPQLVVTTGSDRLDGIALERARVWAEQKLTPDSPTQQVTIPFELTAPNPNIETLPETPTPEDIPSEGNTEKPVPPQSPAPELPEPEFSPQPTPPSNSPGPNPKKPPAQNPSQGLSPEQSSSSENLPAFPADKSPRSSTSRKFLPESLPIEKERLPR